jgi:hypothetical protein
LRVITNGEKNTGKADSPKGVDYGIEFSRPHHGNFVNYDEGRFL